MSSSNDGNDSDKNLPFRKVQTTNLLVNDDNMSSLRDLLEVFLRIRHGIDQQEVIMISETQLETFGPFIREQLANLATMTAHQPDEDSSTDGVEDEAETNPTTTKAEANVPDSEEKDDDEQKTEKDERVVKT